MNKDFQMWKADIVACVNFFRQPRHVQRTNQLAGGRKVTRES